MTDVPASSATDDLALHGLRVLGFATPARVAGRFGLDVGQVTEDLLASLGIPRGTDTT